MALDAFKNNAKVTVSLGYDNAATQIVLQAGDGAKLPAVPFNGEWWNSTDYNDPTDDPNKEIIRFTTQTNTDTFTIVRAQESTSAATHNTAGKVYKIIVGLTAKTLNTDIPATYTAYNATMTTAGGVPYVTSSGTITEDDPNFHWDSTNKRLGIQTNAPTVPLTVSSNTAALPTPTAQTIVHIAGVTAQSARQTLDAFGGTGGAAAQYGFRSAHGGPAAPSGIKNGDQIGGLIWDAYGSSSYSGGAGAGYLVMNTTEDWTDTHQGASMSIAATPTGSSGAVVVVTIKDQKVGIGTSGPAGSLHVYSNNPTVIVDGGVAPDIDLRQNGTNVGAIGIPTATNQYSLDAAVGDVVYRSNNSNLIYSVDNGSSLRELTHPTKTLTSTATGTATIFKPACAANTAVGGMIEYCVECVDSTSAATKVSCEVGLFQWSVINVNGVLTGTGQTVNVFKNSSPALAMTVTWGITSANPAVITVIVTFTVTPASGYPKVTYTMKNFTRQATSPQ